MLMLLGLALIMNKLLLAKYFYCSTRTYTCREIRLNNQDEA